MSPKTDTIEHLAEAFLKCRTFGHAWEPLVTYLEKVGNRRIYRCVLVCAREQDAGHLPSEKEVITIQSGPQAGSLLEAPRYRYSPGYLVAEKVGRGKQRPIARLELMERLVELEKASSKKDRLKAVKGGAA